jgi:hypothetical protein
MVQQHKVASSSSIDRKPAPLIIFLEQLWLVMLSLYVWRMAAADPTTF